MLDLAAGPSSAPVASEVAPVEPPKMVAPTKNEVIAPLCY
jgi:hypothetical protein